MEKVYAYTVVGSGLRGSILSGVGVGGDSLVYANTLFYPTDNFFAHDPREEGEIE